MSLARRDADYLGDIVEAMRRIIAYTEDLTYEAFNCGLQPRLPETPSWFLLQPE